MNRFISLLPALVILVLVYPGKLSAQPEPEFSSGRGFYTNAFSLVISGADSIKYTLDGSDPSVSRAAVIKPSPVTIYIDPESTEGGRGKTAGVTVRAVSLSGKRVSKSVTHTYMFINKITELSPDGIKPGSAWPDKQVGSQVINYGIDPDVVNDPLYKGLVDDAFLSLPSVSLVTDLKNLFSPDSGIFVNAYQDGDSWERETSVELINPDSSEGFQVNAGLRIRGGASRDGQNPKHAFRLFFKKEYGYGNLNFPLFEEEGVKQFDKVDLRTSQNYSWSYPGHQGEYNTMNRDVFSRDLQRELGQPYTRSRYYHLFINGYYWGIYQTQERADAHFAQSYFGGREEDYDVVKPGDGWPATVIATDGNLDAWKEIWNMCLKGFASDSDYFKIQGMNPDGSRNASYKQLLDIDNLIDYMLIIFFTGNFDAPISKFGQNNIPRNFYAIYNRVRNDGFKFIIHDAEHSLRTTAGEGPGTGLNENRVNIGSLPKNDPYRMNVTTFSMFHPQWLHFKLSVNAEYTLRFADRAYKHFFNTGAFTTDKTTRLFKARADEIDTAIIAESARWGDTYANPPRTKEKDWQKAVNDIMNNYFPNRPRIVLNQLIQDSLYPRVDAPVILSNGTNISSSVLNVYPGYPVNFQQPADRNAVIYYTTDGTDPRETGGKVSPGALAALPANDITFSSSAVIYARVKSDAGWSALNKVILLMNDNISAVKFTEIFYHPLESDTAKNDFEFIELKNTGSSPYDLSGAFFDEGINYSFPSPTVIYPGQYIVLAAEKEKFNSRYGYLPFAQYSGKLDNSGEKLLMKSAAEDTICYVRYDTRAPWPESAAGGGYSIVLKEDSINLNYNDGSSWRASFNVNGSPGKEDVVSYSDAGTFLPAEFKLYQNYPNPFNPSTIINFDVPHQADISVVIYDVLGREIIKLASGEFKPGGYTFTWHTGAAASGVYFCMLRSGNFISTKKLMLVR